MRSIPICQAGGAEQSLSLEIANLFEPVSDFFLTDTLISKEGNANSDEQPVPGFVGVTGKICDWDIASSLVKLDALLLLEENSR